jgi:hypothetical protein
MAKARKAAKATSRRKKTAKKSPARKPAARKTEVKRKARAGTKSAAAKGAGARKNAVRKKTSKATPVKRRAPGTGAGKAPAKKTAKSGAGEPAAVEALKGKLRTAVEDRDRQAAESERLRQKGEQLLHQLEAARETISNLRGQLHSGAPADELDLEPEIEDDELLGDEDPATYDFDSVGDDLNLLESRRRELDQARLEQELEQEGQSYWNICSKCGERLEEFEFGGIKADRCESCGVTLFERSEMELLLSVRPVNEIMNRLQMLART